MQTILRNTMRFAGMLLLVAALLGAAGGASAASLPATSCASSAGATTCDVYATTGTTTLFGATAVNIWGFSASLTPGSATLPGPILIAKQGDTVTVTLHNTDLPEATALNFQGQVMLPDSTGVTAGNSKSYTFTASQPGTFLYEAGLVAGKQHQVAMGMYGALVVKPSDGTAYGTPTTAYDEETVLVLSEIDTTLNTVVPAPANPSPASFDMRSYAPKYFLINGKAYASGFTGDIPVTAGNKVLLRYVNAGLQSHAMSTLGISQSVIATDGYALVHPHSMVAETIATGQTLDALVTIPAAAPQGTRFAVFDANLMLRNSAASGFGGMLTFLTAGAIVTPPPTGVITSNVVLSPNPTGGPGPVFTPVTVTATITTTNGGGATVTGAEFYIDSTANGPSPMAPVTGETFNTAAAVHVTGTISSGSIAVLASGTHTIFVRGQDTAGWSPFVAVSLELDREGPTTSGLTLSPNPSSGIVSVALTATGNDTGSGDSNVTAAEYTLDGILPAAAMTGVGSPSPTRNFTANIPAGLTQGDHIVSVRSQDVFGNWGAPVSITLHVVDTTPPTVSSVSASPNPNNGSTPLSTSVQAVRVLASFSDAATGNSNITAAEGFIDTVGVTGTGFVFIANDGLFDSPTEAGYSDIPLVVVGALTNGSHTIYVHARDAGGNWSAMANVILTIDKVGPSTSAVVINPAASNNTAVAVSASASDAATGNSNIAGGELFIDAGGANGAGIAMTSSAASPAATVSGSIPAATIAALTAGSHTIFVHSRDAAGNWGAFATAVLLIDRTPPTFASITLTPNSISQGNASVNLTVNGASDGAGGSGVTGGEYWFGSTNITAGTGTAFSGTTASINTSALTAGSYTVRVRIRDAAGNWSTGINGVRTATLSVTGVIQDAIFNDGFETGNFSGWTSTSTNIASRLSVTNTAALSGVDGMQAQGNNTNYAQFNFGTGANPASATMDARFYFNPNGNTGTNQDIFVARTTLGATIFHVRYRWNGGAPQVQIQVGNTANAIWTPITNAASNRIEVVWQSGSTLQLFVGGSLAANQSLTATANSVAQFRVGSVTSGGSATLEYFDAVSAKRSVTPTYGP